MSIIKYRVLTAVARIEAVEVEKETAQSVWAKSFSFLGGSAGDLKRVAKRSNYDNYFDTWTEAHAFLLEKAEGMIFSARKRLASAQAHLGNVKGMKQPAEGK